jgi:threonine aldolase
MAFDNGIIDLRSDTVTKPTVEMRKAMSTAEVGDDVYEEDPTINRLEELAAEKMGKEASLFVASGTMGNLIAILIHCQRGDEAIMGNKGHTFLHEVGGMSALGGVFANVIANQNDGTLCLPDIANAIRDPDVHHPVTRLVILENTQNQCGGIPLSLDYMITAGEMIHNSGMRLHLDGARIFNAAIALGKSAEKIAEPADSVMFCLSKGLSAPVGSMLCGTKDFIHEARRVRKMLGGGMRQAGVLAAAGIISLNSMIDRLGDDHRRASRVADLLLDIEGIEFDLGMPASNMVFIQLTQNNKIEPHTIISRLKENGILIGQCGPRNFRLVTHCWISDEDLHSINEGFHRVFRS